MKHHIVAVRDRASDSFARPFTCRGLGEAIRDFTGEVNRADANNPLYMYSEDYDLYKIGTFNDNTGEIESIRPEQIAIGKDCKKKNYNSNNGAQVDAFEEKP